MRSIRILILFTLLMLLTACLGNPPKIDPPRSGDGAGIIYVDSPKVFARERLVRDREAQKVWLNRQLTRSDVAFEAFQGAVQSRSFQRRGASLSIDASAAGAASILQSGVDADGLDRAKELADMRQQVELAKLQAQLEAIRAGESIDSMTVTPSDSADSADVPSTTSTDATTVANNQNDPTVVQSASSAASSNDATLPVIGLEPINVKDRPLDRFRDQLAYRDEVRQELMDNDLDDVHDLGGKTLYRFSFDTTIMPNKQSSNWVKVAINIKKSGGICGNHDLTAREKLYLGEAKKSFSSRLERSANIEIQQIQALRNNISIIPAISSRALRSDMNDLYDPTISPRALVKKKLIQDQVINDLAEIRFDYEDVSRLVISVPIDFKDKICKMLIDGGIDPYAITPRESVERISDTSVSQLEQSLALSAAITAGKIGIEGALEYLSILENQQQGIRRQPIVVGYSGRINENGSQLDEIDWQFGWILGPRFHPRYGEPGFDYWHRTTQIPLSAVISMPAWWTSANIKVSHCWIASGSDNCSPDSKNPREYTINLPGDPTALVETILPELRNPQPYLYEPYPELEIGRKERIYIIGDNLWRNPQVFVGTQKADTIEILPDMQGIIATFNKVKAPAGFSQDSPASADVLVWTSEGHASAGFIDLHKPVSEPKKIRTKLPITISSSSNTIISKDGEGTVNMNLVFTKKPDGSANIVENTFIKALRGGFIKSISNHEDSNCEFNINNNSVSCSDNQEVNMTLNNLESNTLVKVRIYFTKNNKIDGEIIAYEDLDWRIK